MQGQLNIGLVIIDQENLVVIAHEVPCFRASSFGLFHPSRWKSELE
jgi:hypothetical protein